MSMNFRTTPSTRTHQMVAFVALWFSIIAAKATAQTAVLFGATGAVGNDILRVLVEEEFFTKLVLVGRRFPPKVTSVLPSSELLEVVRIELADLTQADKHEGLADITTDACFVAVGSAFPHLSDLHDWNLVDVEMAGSITRLCSKMQAKSLAVFTAIDAEENPMPFSDEELAGTEAPMGWWPVLMGTTRVMGLKEQTIVSHAGSTTDVRIFQPSNIITRELRYGWLDWAVFRFHAVFDPWLPTRYHSVTTELLARAMVQDSVTLLSGTRKEAATATWFTYGDFLGIVEKDAEETPRSEF